MATLVDAFSDCDELKGAVQAVPRDGGVVFASDGSDISGLRNPFHPDFEEDPSIYICFACFTGHLAERETTALRLRSAAEASLGYIFPLAALRTGDTLEEQWERRYAWVAFQALCNILDPTRISKRPHSSLIRETDNLALDDLFLDTVSVAVIGRENLANHDVDESVVKLMLRQAGVMYPSSFSAGLPDQLIEWRPRASLRLPSSAISDEREALEEILRYSDSDRSPVGQFMSLYQIVEYAISKIFDWSVANVRDDDITPRKLKDRLLKLPAERWRLSVMGGRCVRGIPHSKLVALNSTCVQFLGLAGEDTDDKTPWWEHLYSVRNILVHDQISVIQQGYHNLRAINLHLKICATEILTYFSQPDFAQVWGHTAPAAPLAGEGGEVREAGDAGADA